jgi:holo-[acyl-carrier-protein] synthase
MIIGVGADLSDIRSIQASLDRFGERFKQRCFTELERTRSDRKPDPAWSYAKRFAAKEACAKALGTGMRADVYWRDMGVVNLRSGQPTLALTGPRGRASGASDAGRTRGENPPDAERRTPLCARLRGDRSLAAVVIAIYPSRDDRADAARGCLIA